MARKSRAEIEAELVERTEEVNRLADERLAGMLPGLIAEITTKVTQQLAESRVAAGISPEARDTDRGLVSALAVEIAKVGDPGNKRRTLDPDVAQKRAAARERMTRLMTEVHVNYEKAYLAKDREMMERWTPVYTCRSKMYLGNVKIDPEFQDPITRQMVATQINWHRVPNEGMTPANEIAKAIHKEFLESIGSVGLMATPKAAWVMSGNAILRSSTNPATRAQVGMPPSPGEPGDAGRRDFDPRRPGHSTVPEKREIAVLGNIAAPAVESVVG